MSSKKTVIVETEPIFGIHIVFVDGSNPVNYYNLSLARALDVLKEWSENWILSPEDGCALNDAVWKWNARARSRDLNRFKIVSVPNDEEDEDENDVEPILEDQLNMEE